MFDFVILLLNDFFTGAVAMTLHKNIGPQYQRENDHFNRRRQWRTRYAGLGYI